MWETYIKIGLPHEASTQRCIQIIRSKIYPMISRLKSDGTIDWFHFLIHGNPNNNVDHSLYFHIRFDVKREIKNPEDLHLPDYCQKDMTKKIEPLKEITGITKSLLRNEEIEEAWRIIGEQSEWMMNMLNIHKDNVEIPISQVIQFMHYFLNMLGLGHKARFVLDDCIYSF